MASSNDWMPTNRYDQLVMVKNWLEVLAVKGPVWKVPAEEVTELRELVNEATELYALNNSSDCTSVIVAKCKFAFKRMIVKMRLIKNNYFTLPRLAAEEFSGLNLKNPSSTRTPILVLNEVPLLSIRLGDFRQLMFECRVKSTKKRCIPYGHNGVLLLWKVGGAVPTTYTELDKSELHSVTRFDLWFKSEDSGKQAYFAACWENERGQRGPVSKIQSAPIT
jgi:hypothetical protein